MNQLIPPNEQGFETVVHFIRDGGVIAYPTEAVFGLGCDPFNQQAVTHLLNLKSRREQKGLLLIASQFSQLKPLLALEEVSAHHLNQALMTWPGPYTWVFPASPLVPSWIRGDFSSVAVRVTQHPIAKQLCEHYGGPVVSTSANRDGELPAKTAMDVFKALPKGLSAVLDGEVGQQARPTQIRDILTGKIIRFA